MSIYKKLAIKSKIRDYTLFFCDNFLDGFRDKTDKKYFIIIDQKVRRLYAKRLKPILKRYPFMAIRASERHKTLEYINVIIRNLIDSKVRRDYALLAIGGGIIQDIAGFAASILCRGIEWNFYPTTLLAQSDSCIGSKTSVNIGEYKNQVGNFYPPSSIFLDVGFLRTLTPRDIKSGLGEIIKVHLLDGIESTKYIEENYASALYRPEAMQELILRSLKIKKRVIESDEFDAGYRNIMNYGHTFGHALESLTDYKLPHGQAVTVGMDISNFLSSKFGYINKTIFLRMRGVLLKNWPDFSLDKVDMDLFFKSLSKDKKNTGGKVTMILTCGPGKMFRKSFLLGRAMKAALVSYFKEQPIGVKANVR